MDVACLGNFCFIFQQKKKCNQVLLDFALFLVRQEYSSCVSNSSEERLDKGIWSRSAGERVREASCTNECIYECLVVWRGKKLGEKLETESFRGKYIFHVRTFPSPFQREKKIISNESVKIVEKGRKNSTREEGEEKKKRWCDEEEEERRTEYQKIYWTRYYFY